MSRAAPGRAGRRGAASALLLAVLLTACAPVRVGAWSPPVWPPAALAVTHPPAPLDPAADGLASLTPLRLRNDAVRIQARVAFLPGAGAAAAAFNEAVETRVRDAIAAQSAASGVSYSPAAHPQGAGLGDRACVAGSTTADAATVLEDPALGPAGGAGTAVVCEIVAAAGPFLAQRIRVVTGTPDAVAADTTTTLYVDTATGELATPDLLWTDAAAATLGTQIVDALRRDAGALSLGPASAGDDAQLAAIRAGLETTVPADGALVLTIAPGFAAPELVALGVAATTEPLAVEVPAEVAARVLSPFGTRVLAASGQPYSGPSAAAAGHEWLDCTLVPCVALTYDDGPSALTPRLLDELRDRRAAATFYMLGQSAAGAPDTVRRAAAEGHDIGNHTWSHPHLLELDDAAIAAELTRTRDLLRSLSGQAVATWRPPYGEFSQRVVAAAGQTAITWTIDTHDWAGPTAEALLASAVDGATPGAVILFHDTHERSVDVAPAVIDGLRDRGFTAATVTQLFGGSLPASGVWRAAP